MAGHLLKKLSMVKAFVLDLDGTLIDSHDLHVASFKPLLTKHKLVVKGAVLKKYFGMTAEDILKKAFPELTNRVINSIVRTKRKLFLDNIHLVKKLKCADSLLKLLSTKGLVAIASSAHISEIKAVINQLGWSNHFSLLLSGYDVANPKPAPDVLLEAVKCLRVLKGNCVFIGDSIYDALAARSAHIKFVGVTTGSFSKKHFNELGFKQVYSTLCSLTKNYSFWKP